MLDAGRAGPLPAIANSRRFKLCAALAYCASSSTSPLHVTGYAARQRRLAAQIRLRRTTQLLIRSLRRRETAVIVALKGRAPWRS
jgi:hypothetical protein